MPWLRIALLALTLFPIAGSAQDPQAVDALRRAQQAAGGVEALAAVKDKIVTRDIRGVGGGISGSQVVKIILPDAMRQESVLPFGRVVLSLVDGEAKIQSPQGATPLSPPQLAQAQAELFHTWELLLLADRTSGVELRYVRAEDADRLADVIEVAQAKSGQSVRLWIDKATGECFKAAYDLPGSQHFEERYSDFRDVEGVRTPFAIEVRAGDRVLSQIRVQKVLYNTGLTKAELR